MNNIDRPLNILLIEDNPSDTAYTREILKDSKFSVRVYIITDGKEAMSFLKRSKDYEHAMIPDLILLDLNVPYINGFELLSEIKADLDLSKIPVIVLTTSTDRDDVKKAHTLKAYCYFVKPLDIDEFDRVVRKLKESSSFS